MDAVDRKPFFKGPRVTEKERRRRKREARDKRERDHKGEARERDRKVTKRGCRFALCGCSRFKAGVNRAIEISHLRHKSMGGNPKEDRSVPQLLIAVCGQRHKDGRIAIDKGTLECRPLTDAGTDGPVAWWLDGASVVINYGEFPLVDGWFELAREKSPGVLEPLTPLQQEALEFLARMEF